MSSLEARLRRSPKKKVPLPDYFTIVSRHQDIDGKYVEVGKKSSSRSPDKKSRTKSKTYQNMWCRV